MTRNSTLQIKYARVSHWACQRSNQASLRKSYHYTLDHGHYFTPQWKSTHDRPMGNPKNFEEALELQLEETSDTTHWFLQTRRGAKLKSFQVIHASCDQEWGVIYFRWRKLLQPSSPQIQELGVERCLSASNLALRRLRSRINLRTHRWGGSVYCTLKRNK